MNKIKVWCPYCNEYEYIQTWYNVLNHKMGWAFYKCRYWLRDKEVNPVYGYKELVDVLNSGIWLAGEKINRQE